MTLDQTNHELRVRLPPKPRSYMRIKNCHPCYTLNIVLKKLEEAPVLVQRNGDETKKLRLQTLR